MCEIKEVKKKVNKKEKGNQKKERKNDQRKIKDEKKKRCGYFTLFEDPKADVICDQLSLVYSSVSIVLKLHTVNIPWSSKHISNLQSFE